mgnify:CR=1 FL=1|tara:strand:+ start:4547 stop:5038 length:492 start_codon:yes stop_codon:yes gene_type:complete
MSDDNKWSQPDAPPPPLFTGKKERDYVKQVNDELIEQVIGQTIIYYPVSVEHTQFNKVYGEAVKKTFLSPIKVNAFVVWESEDVTTTNLGVDRIERIKILFHKRRITEDQNLFVREGDFVKFSDRYYEILTLIEPRWLFGQGENSFEIAAQCVRAREGLFDAN